MSDDRSRLIAAVEKLDGVFLGAYPCRYVSLSDVLAILQAQSADPQTDRDRQGVCEQLVQREHPRDCGQPAVWRYPASGGGFMRLCASHGETHRRYCERWTTEGWRPLPASPERGEDQS